VPAGLVGRAHLAAGESFDRLADDVRLGVLKEQPQIA